jgi:hypothetical protein
MASGLKLRRRRRRTGVSDEARSLAPVDPLAREIQRVLELVKPLQVEDSDDPAYNGYCVAATEAYLHLAGGRASSLKVMRAGHSDGTSHWWLVGPRGVIDLMYSPGDRRKLRSGALEAYPYDEGKGAMFQNGYARPSKRAAALIEVVKSRRRSSG